MIRGFSWLQFAAVLCTRAVAYSSPELITRKAQFRLLAARCNRGFQASPATTGALRTMAENLEATAASDADAAALAAAAAALAALSLNLSTAGEVVGLSGLGFSPSGLGFPPSGFRFSPSGFSALGDALQSDGTDRTDV